MALRISANLNPSLPMKLQNKTIIITGASKGLGVSMAEECAREGARVVITAPSLAELETVAD